MTTPTYVRSMTVALAPMTVACPRCHATRGSFCISAGGYQNSAVGFHAARRKLVANLTDDERYDAYAAMRAEQEQRRAEAEAERDAFYADPAKVAALHAGWAAQREAMAAVNAELRAEEREMRARCRDPQWVPPPLPTPRPVGVAPVADLAAERTRRKR